MDTTTSTPETNDLIERLGLSEMPEELQTEFLDRFNSMLFDAIFYRGLDELSDEQRTELNTIVGDSEDPKDIEKIFAYFEGKVTNLDQMVTEETDRLIADINEEALEQES